MLFYQLLTLATISSVAIALPTPVITIQERVLNSRAFEPENKSPRTVLQKDLVPRNGVDDILKFIEEEEANVLPLIVW